MTRRERERERRLGTLVLSVLLNQRWILIDPSTKQRIRVVFLTADAPNISRKVEQRKFIGPPSLSRSLSAVSRIIVIYPLFFSSASVNHLHKSSSLSNFALAPSKLHPLSYFCFYIIPHVSICILIIHQTPSCNSDVDVVVVTSSVRVSIWLFASRSLPSLCCSTAWILMLCLIEQQCFSSTPMTSSMPRSPHPRRTSNSCMKTTSTPPIWLVNTQHWLLTIPRSGNISLLSLNLSRIVRNLSTGCLWRMVSVVVDEMIDGIVVI